LVIPYRYRNDQVEFAVLRRNDAEYWQFVAGGGEEGETPILAARREAGEEAGIDADGAFAALDTLSAIPKECFAEAAFWPADVYVIPEYCFATEVGEANLSLSGEHAESRWLTYDDALQLLKWDSNCTALWELNERLKDGNLAGIHAALGGVFHGANETSDWAAAPPVGVGTQTIEKIAVLDNAVQARALDSILTDQGIPHAMLSYHDSAYDGLFQGSRGWGHVEAPAEYREEILATIEGLNQPDPSGESDAEGGPER
jgi:dATP pyrophosphohydrolase